MSGCLVLYQNTGEPDSVRFQNVIINIWNTVVLWFTSIIHYTGTRHSDQIIDSLKDLTSKNKP